jgi:hypothetical protein
MKKIALYIIVIFNINIFAHSQDSNSPYIPYAIKHQDESSRLRGAMPLLNRNEGFKYLESFKKIRFNTPISNIFKIFGPPSKSINNECIYDICFLADRVIDNYNGTLDYHAIIKSDSSGTKVNRILITKDPVGYYGPPTIVFSKGMSDEEFYDFVKKIKNLSLGEETPDDISNKTEISWLKKKTIDGEEWIHSEEINSVTVRFQIQVGKNGKLSSVIINKENDVIYNKSLSDINPPIAPSSNVIQISKSSNSPIASDEGQIYFNTTDKHFYGWNGNEWKQLDK